MDVRLLNHNRLDPFNDTLGRMKLTSDERGRLAGDGLIPSNTTFEAQTDTDGSIRLVEVSGLEVPIVSARKVGGRLIGAPIALDRKVVAPAIRAERDGR